MELSYGHLKTRFLFAINSGYRSKGLFQELSKATPYDIFRDLLVIDLQRYLDHVCRGLTEEEYYVYKHMIKIQLKEEDEIFKELSRLTNSIATQEVIARRH